MPLHLHKVGLTLKIHLANETIERHAVASPDIVGNELALQVDAVVRNQGLGYYPALDYFKQQALIDKDLLDSVDGLSWLGCNLVREELQRKLRPLFTQIAINTIHSGIYALPNVRPGQPNAIHDLAQHYMPNLITVELSATLMQKQAGLEGIEQFAHTVVARNLNSAFDQVEVISVRPE